MIELHREVLLSVISSLIGSVLLLMIAPVFRKLGSWIIKVVTHHNRKLRDSIYKHAAKRVLPYSSDLNLLVVFIFLFSSTILIYLESPEAINLFTTDFPYRPIILFVFISIVAAYFLFRLGIRKSVENLIIKFDNTIRFIRPHVAEQEIHLIESEWVVMKSHEDFLIIKKSLDRYRQVIKDTVSKKAVSVK
jgi:uncharacterized protein YacL